MTQLKKCCLIVFSILIVINMTKCKKDDETNDSYIIHDGIKTLLGSGVLFNYSNSDTTFEILIGNSVKPDLFVGKVNISLVCISPETQRLSSGNYKCDSIHRHNTFRGSYLFCKPSDTLKIITGDKTEIIYSYKQIYRIIKSGNIDLSIKNDFCRLKFDLILNDSSLCKGVFIGQLSKGTSYID